ncbi:competence protein ComFA [Paenibacillus endophyticus]|uniref:Competence protein ComFA n=1 Tax=Paenibacillus endophyticus TaxID=1294268 RepID=A0A7W5CBG0_9BACL|nr:helicase-related protein [Paenibacillus endophyticus]MBB3154623.1 competence protein ComFA [Paenibacillus endophyticus]
MKAQIYVVMTRGGWQAEMSIHAAIDRHFWMDGHYGGAGCLNKDKGEWGWLLREELPLGDACLAVELWESVVFKRSGVKAAVGQQGKRKREAVKVKMEASCGDGYEAIELLIACAKQAKQIAQEGKENAGLGRWLRFGSKQKKLAKLGEDGLLRLAERWVRKESSGWEGEAEEGDILARRRERGAVNEWAERGERGGVGGRIEWGESRGMRAELEGLAAGAKCAASMLQGRALLRSEAHALLSGAGGPGAAAGWSEMLQLAALLGQVRLGGSIAAADGGRSGAQGRRRRERRCLRCGSGEAAMHRTACAACGRVCAYCTACIGMGRSRECELLVTGQRPGLHGAERSDARGRRVLSHEQRLDKWQLSPAQTAAAAKALQFVEASYVGRDNKPEGREEGPREFLLWAVTGAGKTEIIFPLVESVLLRGGKVLIATPRRDVVIELDPRIRKAFPSAAVVTLYGGSEQRWECGDITLATTHQLLRFYQGFDLVVVDELDAFPFAGDPLLHYAADKSCAPGAARLLLSATPPSELQRAAKRGRLPHARVPVRYHRHPLPVPKLLQTPTVKQMLQQKRLPAKLLSALQDSLSRGAQLFVFVQQIAQTEPMAVLLRAALFCLAVSATSSQDAERTDKVQRFRARDIRVLVTTTILERGVTIPKSDVYILDADGSLFDEASLVQMAGRAGRSVDDPFGSVYFCSRERNRPQQQAVSHIQTMNRMARKQGYLLPSGKGGSHR